MAAERHGLLMPRPPPQLSLKQLWRMLKYEMLYLHQSTSIPCRETGEILICDLSQLTLDPVQPSSAKANWLMGETTRSTLTALHDLCLDSSLFSWTSLDAWWPWSSLWLWVHELDWGLASGLMRVCAPVSECAVPGFLFSLKMEKHLSNRSMLEDGWVGRSSDSR